MLTPQPPPRRAWSDPWRASPKGARLALGAAAVVGSAALLVDPPGRGQLSWFVLGAGLALVVGELFPVRVGRRVVAPVSTAASLALATTPTLGGGAIASAATIISVLWICFLLGQLAATTIGATPSEASMPARFLGVAVTTVLCRGVPVAGYESLLHWIADPRFSPIAAALLLLAAAALGGIVERALDVLITWRDGERGLGSVLGAELGPVSGISAAVVATAPLIALTFPLLGVVALPLFLLPISLVLLSLRRYLGVQRTQAEVLDALSHLPAVAAGGRQGHPRRVASLSVLVARQLGLDEDAQRRVERTALLHDIGQIGLEVPLDHGATLDAPPQQIEQIVRSGQQVVSRSVAWPGLSETLSTVHEPYRHILERGAEQPVEARVVKVVNAFDDLTEGASGQRVVELALERLHLGLGYEYDPEVVAALERVVLAPARA